MTKQIILIHGGTTFETRAEFLKFLRQLNPSLEYLREGSWKDSFQSLLGEEFDVIRLKMPNKMNARYDEWKIYFERHIPLFEEEVILVGHSLGGVFLAKYLSENTFPKRIKALFLIAAPYEAKGTGESLGDFILVEDLRRVQEQSGEVFIYQSTDDLAVPFSHAEKFQQAMPEATLVTFDDKQHFNQQTFPELAAHIQKLY